MLLFLCCGVLTLVGTFTSGPAEVRTSVQPTASLSPTRAGTSVEERAPERTDNDATPTIELSVELQLVELHFRQRPELDFSAVKRRAESILGSELQVPEAKSGTETFLFFHKSHPVTYADGKAPAQTAILAVHKPIDMEAYAEDVQQSWGCPDAASLLENSAHTLLVTEMMTQLLEPGDRVRLFHGVLQAVIAETTPDALVFKHSQQVVDPEAYLAAIEDAPINRPGSLNVRFFNISNSDGDMIMDVRGLQEVGLHDLQCHFRGLDPSEVGRVLLNSANYIFENGSVIESGNTIAGVEPDSKWICQFENSLVSPERELLDLNPGAPFAAGGRN